MSEVTSDILQIVVSPPAYCYSATQYRRPGICAFHYTPVVYQALLTGAMKMEKYF